MISNKEYWVNLLFEVQTGNRSCRNAADIIMDAINYKSRVKAQTPDILGQDFDDPCPSCNAKLKSAPGGGVVCTDRECRYWFCY